MFINGLAPAMGETCASYLKRGVKDRTIGVCPQTLAGSSIVAWSQYEFGRTPVTHFNFFDSKALITSELEATF